LTPDHEQDGVVIYCADALDVLQSLSDNSVDLIATDPPYFKVKNEPWDRQWDKPDQFLAWLDTILAEFYRVLKPNGSLYLFASPKMAARVEVLIGERFNVLNRVTWQKPPYSTKAEMFDKATLRSFFPASEALIFAEHYGADGIAKGESGYGTKCDELRGFVFEPLRAYLDGERERAGCSVQDVAEMWRVRTGNKNRTGMAGHWFSRVQFMPPTRENYEWLREQLNAHMNGTGPVLRREYEDLRREYEDLRREYEDLRREYEDLRRPFNVTADVPYTDVWTFPTVSSYPGKHPCEKPLAMMQHIIRASSRDGAVVLDPFMGGGTTLAAARSLGRSCVGVDMSRNWCDHTIDRLAQKAMAI